MPSNNQSRARSRRSINTSGTEVHQDALSLINDSLNDIVQSLTEKAKQGDNNAAKQILDMAKDEFVRARSGANDPMMIRVQQIREAGSPKLEALWAQMYRNVPIEMETSLP